MRVVFMGSSAFATPALQAVAAAHQVVAVYARPPQPAGRGRKLRECPVSAAAQGISLRTHTPENFRNAQEITTLSAYGADVVVVAAYGLLLPPAVLGLPRFGCLNIHASLLPRWRGAAPIHRAIMAGDVCSGITIMRMDAGLDTGAVLLKEAVPITDSTTSGMLSDVLSKLGAKLLLRTLDMLPTGGLSAEPQRGEGATYAAKIDKSEARIDWSRSASDVARHINGLSPYPAAWFNVDGQRVKVLQARPETALQAAHPPGVVIDDAGLIACGNGAVRLLRLQRPGGAQMLAADFLRGFSLAKGLCLS